MEKSKGPSFDQRYETFLTNAISSTSKSNPMTLLLMMWLLSKQCWLELSENSERALEVARDSAGVVRQLVSDIDHLRTRLRDESERYDNRYKQLDIYLKVHSEEIDLNKEQQERGDVNLKQQILERLMSFVSWDDFEEVCDIYNSNFETLDVNFSRAATLAHETCLRLDTVETLNQKIDDVHLQLNKKICILQNKFVRETRRGQAEMTNTTLPNNFDAQSNGRGSSVAFVDEFMPRDPTPYDISYPIQKKWLNTLTNAFWELKNFVSAQGVTTANWVLVSSQGSSTQTLTGNDGIHVPPTANNINVLGDVTNILTSGNIATSTLTVSLNGNIANSYVENTGSATPSGGILNVLGTGGITTTGSGNTITIELSGDIPAIQGIVPDAHTGPGTTPVTPDSSGNITVTGGQVAAGTTTNVIRTDSLAANTYTVEVQRSQAVGSSTVGDNGVSHFNSAIFSVDSNAFVDLSTSFYTTGSWTPTLSFGGASVGITYSVQDGRYTRIGNLVFCYFDMQLSSKGSSTGMALINGLPFTALNTLPVYSGLGTLAYATVALDATYTFMNIGVLVNSTTAGIAEYTPSGSSMYIVDTNFNNTSLIRATFLYFI